MVNARAWDEDEAIVRSAAEARSFAELRAGAAQQIAKLFDSHTALWMSVDGGGAVSGGVFVGEQDLFDRYRELSSFADPLIDLKRRMNPRLAVTTALVDRRRLVRSDLYGTLYGPGGYEHHLAMRITDDAYGHPHHASLVFCRDRKQRNWSAHELRRMQRLLPALEIAMKRIRRNPTAPAPQALEATLHARAQDALPFGVWDQHGKACWLSQRAQTLGLSLRDLKRVDAPSSLALRWAELSGHAPRFDGDSRVWLTTRDGCLQGDLVTSRAHDADPLYVLLVPKS